MCGVPTVFIEPLWCHACGRVAGELDFGKEHAVKAILLDQGDIFLGTKTISSSLHTHDPRKMGKFRKRWAESKGKPEFRMDVRRNRNGRRTLSSLLGQTSHSCATILAIVSQSYRATNSLSMAASTQEPDIKSPLLRRRKPSSSTIPAISSCGKKSIQRNSNRFAGGGPRHHLDPLGGR
jgi:hypothetical protein